jgi:hypothetical protein
MHVDNGLGCGRFAERRNEGMDESCASGLGEASAEGERKQHMLEIAFADLVRVGKEETLHHGFPSVIMAVYSHEIRENSSQL